MGNPFFFEMMRVHQINNIESTSHRQIKRSILSKIMIYSYLKFNSRIND